MPKGLNNSKQNRVTGHWTQDTHGRLSVQPYASAPGNKCKGSRKGFCSLCDCHQMNWVGLVIFICVYYHRGAAMNLFATY